MKKAEFVGHIVCHIPYPTYNGECQNGPFKWLNLFFLFELGYFKQPIWHFRQIYQKWTILQTLNNREIKRLGLFECCGSEWKGRETKVNCRKCGKEVIPTEFEELEERWFGHFECSTKEFGWERKPCGRRWKSSWTWTIDQGSTD